MELIIKNILEQDYVDSSAAAIQALNSTIFASASDVPTYCYTSLATLVGVSSSVLPSRIVANYGEAVTPTSMCIVIQPTRVTESVDSPWGMRSDEPGAECGYIDILVKNVRTTTSVSPVKNIQARIRLLIDATLRQYRREANTLGNAGDNSILNDYVLSFWEMDGILFASEYGSRYRCEFIKAYPSVLP